MPDSQDKFGSSGSSQGFKRVKKILDCQMYIRCCKIYE